jgi:diguanylate cyclase (GGDEF)-like protein/PAS domain S-box-containing protein
MPSLPLRAILSPHPVTVPETIAIRDALAVMEQRRISCLLAVDADQRPTGIFTEQDAVRLLDADAHLDAMTMAEAMHQPVFAVPADMDYREAYQQMSTRGYRHLVVTHADGRLAGVVSEGDFMHHLGMEYLVELKTVASAMTPHPVTLPEDARLSEAVALMAERHFSCILVTRDGVPAGMITERDLVHLAQQDIDPALTPLAQVMQGPVQSIDAHAPVQAAVLQMQQAGIRRLAVFDNQRLVGLVTRHDIVKTLQGRYIEYLHQTIERQREEATAAEAQLATLRQRLQNYSLMEQVSDAIFIMDAETMALVDVNGQACRSLGYSREALLALTLPELSTTSTDPVKWQAIRETIRAQGQLIMETGQRRSDGSVLPVQVNVRLVTVDGREYALAVARDLSSIQAQNAQLQLQIHALNAAANAIVITDTEPRILWANAAFTALTGYALDEAIGRRPAELVSSGKQEPAFYKQLWDTILAGEVWHGELVNRRKDGSYYDEELTITPVRMDGMNVSHFIAIKQDVSTRKTAEAELRTLATTDTLTDLANRRHFMEQLTLALARHQRHETPSALLMLDLDWFKSVNDRHGHAVGDQVLVHIARTLQASLRRIDLLGRLGGEEFAILLPDTEITGAVEFSERLRRSIAKQPAITRAGEIPMTASIGVTAFADTDHTIDTILARADRALYRAKANGRNRVELESSAN